MTLSDKGRECSCACHVMIGDNLARWAKVKKGKCRHCNPAKQEAPTKQGDEELCDECEIPLFLCDMVYFSTLHETKDKKEKAFLMKSKRDKIRSLLRSKDQEADKRVEAIEKAIQDQINGITSFQTSPQSYQGLSEALDILKNMEGKLEVK